LSTLEVLDLLKFNGVSGLKLRNLPHNLPHVGACLRAQASRARLTSNTLKANP
jgi:hypothetical protein